MLILAIDTALAACSAALYDTDAGLCLAERFEPMQRGHAERLADMVQDVFRQAGRQFAELDRIAVTTGPGTFTGVRIGVSFARGLALAVGCPAVGITTLTALAATVQQDADEKPVAVLIDARRGDVYYQLFSSGLDPLCAPQTVSVAGIAALLPDAPVLGIGSGVHLAQADCPQLIASDLAGLPDPGVMARFAGGLAEPDGPPVPLYLRAPDAKAQAPLLSFARADIVIREAGLIDGQVLAAIHAESFVKSWPQSELVEVMFMPGTFTLIACDAETGGEPLGFVMVRQAADEAEVITIATRPQARRRGVAGALLDRAIGRLKAAGCRDLHLEVDETNAAAMAFYARVGFTGTGRRVDYYTHADGTRADAVIMHRDV